MFMLYFTGVRSTADEVRDWLVADLAAVERDHWRLFYRWGCFTVGLYVKGIPRDAHVTDQFILDVFRPAPVPDERLLLNPSFEQMVREDLICVLERRGFQITDLHSWEE